MSSHLSQNPRAVRWTSPAVLNWVRERIKAAGGDPAEVPEMPFKLLPLAAVRELTGFSTSTLYQDAGVWPISQGNPGRSRQRSRRVNAHKGRRPGGLPGSFPLRRRLNGHGTRQ